MQQIAWIFYSILALTCLTSAGFIIFHILRYSLCHRNALAGVGLFLIVFGILFLTNITLFSALPLETLFGPSSIVPHTNGF